MRDVAGVARPANQRERLAALEPLLPRFQERRRQYATRFGSELNLTITEAPMAIGGSDGNFGAAMGLPSLDGLGAVGGTEADRQFIYCGALPRKGALLAGVIQDLPALLDRRGAHGV